MKLAFISEVAKPGIGCCTPPNFRLVRMWSSFDKTVSVLGLANRLIREDFVDFATLLEL
jgi:hypothetical protein